MKHVKTKPIKFVKTQTKPAQAKTQAKKPKAQAKPKLEEKEAE